LITMNTQQVCIEDPCRQLERARAMARGESDFVIAHLWNPVCTACAQEMQRVALNELWHWKRFECQGCGAIVENST
jgi:hypothetical protein